GGAIDGDPFVVVEVGGLVRRGCLDRCRPGCAVVVRGVEEHLLAADLREWIAEARVVDGRTADPAEGSTRAPRGAVVERGIAAAHVRRCPGQGAAGPGDSVVGRAVEAVESDPWCERARACERCGGARAERLLDLVVRACNQDAAHRIADDRVLVLLVLRE